MNKILRYVTIAWFLMMIGLIVMSVWGLNDLREQASQAAEEGRSSMGAAAIGLIYIMAIGIAIVSIIDCIIIYICARRDVSKTAGVIVGFLTTVTTCVIPGLFLVAYSMSKPE